MTFAWRVGAIALGAFAVRVGFVLTSGFDLSFGDVAEYFEGARRLLTGAPLAQRNWMMFVRAPGYSVFVAAVWQLFGESVVALKLVQSLTSALGCIWAARVARRLAPTLPGAGEAAAILVALYPYFIHHAATPGTESVFGTLVLISTYEAAVGLSEGRAARLLAAGVLLAAANLLRPNLMTFVPLAVLWLGWVWRTNLKQLVARGALIVTAVALVSAPWVLHVHAQGLGWVPITDGGPVWYFMGHNDDAYELHCGHDLSPARYAELMAFPGQWAFTKRPVYFEATASQEPQHVFMQAALAWDSANASKLPCLTMNKAWSYVRPWVNPRVFSPLYVLVSLTTLVLYVLAALGLRAWRARGEGDDAARVFVGLAALQCLAGLATAALFSTEIRYRIPIVDVLLMPVAGLGVAWLLQRVRRKPTP